MRQSPLEPCIGTASGMQRPSYLPDSRPLLKLIDVFSEWWLFEGAANEFSRAQGLQTLSSSPRDDVSREDQKLPNSIACTALTKMPRQASLKRTKCSMDKKKPKKSARKLRTRRQRYNPMHERFP